MKNKTYTFFWSINSPFSQFYPSFFTIDNLRYNCAEQYMMHQKAIFFNDDDFLINRGEGRSRAIKFFQMVIDAKKKGQIRRDLKFYLQTKIRNVIKKKSGGVFVADKELLDVMKNAGVVNIALGVESFSDRMLSSPSINKNITKNGAIIAVEGIRAAGLSPLMNIILLPPKIRVKDFEETVDTIIDQVKKGAQLSLYPFIDWFPGAAISDKIRSGAYYYTTEEYFNRKTRSRIKYPVSILPYDDELRKSAENLEKNKNAIMNDLQSGSKWPFKYPPQLIMGLITIAAVYRGLSDQDRGGLHEYDKKVSGIKKVIWEIALSGRLLNISGRQEAPIYDVDSLVKISDEIMTRKGNNEEDFTNLLVVAREFKTIKPGVYNKIIDYICDYLNGIIEKYENGVFAKKKDELTEKEKTMISNLVKNLARIDIESPRVERKVALFNFLGILDPEDTNILNDIYLDEDDIVTLLPSEERISRPEMLGAEFKGKVMIIEPHPDDAVMHIGNVLEKIIVPNSEEVKLISFFNDPNGVEDKYAREWIDKIFSKESSLLSAKKKIRNLEGQMSAKELKVKFEDMNLAIKEEDFEEAKEIVRNCQISQIVAVICSDNGFEIVRKLDIPVIQYHNETNLIHYLESCKQYSINVAPVLIFRENEDILSRITQFNSIIRNYLNIIEYVLIDSSKGNRKVYEHGLKIPLNIIELFCKYIHKPGIAGGISIENVVHILRLKPYLIDVSSSLEIKPGIKNPELVKKFLEIVRNYEKQ